MVMKKVADEIVQKLEPLKRWGFEVEQSGLRCIIRWRDKRWVVEVKEMVTDRDVWVESSLVSGIVAPGGTTSLVESIMSRVVLEVIAPPSSLVPRVPLEHFLFIGNKVWKLQFRVTGRWWVMSLWRTDYHVDITIDGRLEDNPIRAYAELVRKALELWEKELEEELGKRELSSGRK